jgi:hypothetical protein
MIRGKAILDISPARGIPDAIDTVLVRHVSGEVFEAGIQVL